MAIDPPYRLDPFRNIINIRWEPISGGSNPYDHCWLSMNTYSKSATSYYWEQIKIVTWTFGGTEYYLTPGSSDNAAIIAMALAEMTAQNPEDDTEIKFYNGLYITWDVGPTGYSGDAITAVGAYSWNWNEEDTSCGPTPEGPWPGVADENGRPSYHEFIPP